MHRGNKCIWARAFDLVGVHVVVTSTLVADPDNVAKSLSETESHFPGRANAISS